MKNFFGELKRRNVIRVGLVYLAAAWLIAQVAGLLGQWFELSSSTMQLMLILLGLGFPVALVLAWLFELTPEGVKRTSEVDAEQSIRPLTGRKLDRLFVIIFGCVVVLLLADRFLIHSDQTAWEAATPPLDARDVTSGQPSIAVLPFVDLSPNTDQGYFADGISEEILNSLARLNDLQVTARTSSFYFKGKNEDLRVIGETLGVENVLEGSVRKAGNQVRITAQLNNARTGYHLWSKTYDRTLDDIFAIQEDIAMQVTEAIGISLGVGQLSRVPGMTRNVEAFDEVLQGQALLRQANPQMTISGIQHLRRAVDLDPTFAIGYMQLRGAYLDGALIVPARAAEWRQKAAEAFKKARALAPDLPFVTATLAFESANQGNWLAAGSFYQDQLPALIAKYGADRGATLPTGAFLIRVGRTRDAIEYLERARAENPLATNVSYTLGDAYARIGNVAAAFGEFERGLKLEGAQTFVRGGGLIAALGTRNRSLIDKWAALSQEVSIGVENLADFLDDPAAGLAAVRRWAADAEARNNVLLINILAHWAAYYGDPDLALDLLRKGEVPRSAALRSYTIWRPNFTDVRKLPGFKDLVRDMGYLAYWKKYGWADLCHPISSGNGGGDDFECE